MKWPFLFLRVFGHSMESTFKEGDLVLVNRWVYLWRKPKVGDIVVARDPININRLILKRIKDEQKNRYMVAGDNKGHSIPRKITKRAILGKVIGLRGKIDK
ncbi:S26 family signal peptidase [Candidatus Microgenomates bacterium]|nr:S26 family signal peptidase [Candidatus Microgenomates bacterium]